MCKLLKMNTRNTPLIFSSLFSFCIFFAFFFTYMPHVHVMHKCVRA